MSGFRNLYLDRLREDKVYIAKGYHLDDPEQWLDVKQIPEEIEDKVSRLYLDGFNVVSVKAMLPDEYKWIADFMAIYHDSLYKGRHGLHSQI